MRGLPGGRHPRSLLNDSVGGFLPQLVYFGKRRQSACFLQPPHSVYVYLSGIFQTFLGKTGPPGEQKVSPAHPTDEPGPRFAQTSRNCIRSNQGEAACRTFSVCTDRTRTCFTAPFWPTSSTASATSP